jgi:hypothetical protein
MALLAAIVALVLIAAPAASDQSANDSTDTGNPGNTKDFAGMAEIGGGRKMHLERHGKGSPKVVLVEGPRSRPRSFFSPIH